MPFSKDHQLQLMDMHQEGPYSHLLKYFTSMYDVVAQS